MKTNMRILYLIAGTYRPAGMERVLANKANWLVAHGYEVMVSTTDQKGRPNAFGFDERIRFVDLGINYEENNGKSFLNKLVRYPGKQLLHRWRLKRLIGKEKPDVVVSMFCNDASFVPRIACGAKTVLEIHFSRFKRIQYGRRGLWALADRLRSRNDLRVVGRFDRFVVLTEEDREYWGDLENIEVIPNARTFRSDAPAALEAKTVVAVGRYNFQKQFELLLDAWNLVTREFPDWVLRLVGDGEDRKFLENRIAYHKIQDRVVLGPESDMRTVYENASVLALSSRFEGLPMVLLEAQAAGLPVVSFACKCGPRDVITDGVDGFLVEEGDVVGLADRLFELMADAGLRTEMGRRAYANSERFSEETIMKKWTDLFERL